MKFAINAWQMEEKKVGRMSKAEFLFAKAWEESDTILEVEAKKLHVHSLIISFHSFVLKEKLKETKTIMLEDVAYEQMVGLLAMMYPQYETNLCKFCILFFIRNFQSKNN
jgi:BTB/POZ domain.